MLPSRTFGIVNRQTIVTVNFSILYSIPRTRLRIITTYYTGLPQMLFSAR